MADCPDIEFSYEDSDSYENEIAELYSYTEISEFQLNIKAFETVCAELKILPLWQSLTEENRKLLVIQLLDYLELCDKTSRMKAARAFLYIVQGCWGEVQSDKEQSYWARQNSFLLYELGVWNAMLEVLYLEIGCDTRNELNQKLNLSMSLSNSSDLRVILSILYSILESIRISYDGESNKISEMRKDFQEELATWEGAKGEIIAVTLLNMVTRFCNGTAPHFPLKKILLLLWKILLFTLGGIQNLKNLKTEYRSAQNLSVCWEDSLEVSKTLRPSTPPGSATDLIDQQNNPRKRPLRRQELMKQSSLDDAEPNLDDDDSEYTIQLKPIGELRCSFDREKSDVIMKNSELIVENSDLVVENSELIGKNSELIGRNSELFEENSDLIMEKSQLVENFDATADFDFEEKSQQMQEKTNSGMEKVDLDSGVDDSDISDDNIDSLDSPLSKKSKRLIVYENNSMPIDDWSVDDLEPNELPQPSTPRTHTPLPQTPGPKLNRGLPWTPKVRQKDIDTFLDITRIKFVGYPLHGDRSSLAGLPEPIHEGVNVLLKHVYRSLSEIQIEREEKIFKNPMSQPENDVLQTHTEILYRSLLPTLPQCMIALLKILLAAAPTSKSKTDGINIMADVLPEDMPTSVVQSLKLGLDVNRHKELLVKPISAILLLLLKHFKINHVYQFEFMSQHLVFANCIPLILKFFNQTVMSYVQAKNSIGLLDFPACVIGDPPTMTAEDLENCGIDSSACPAVPGTSSPTNSIEMTSSFSCWRNTFSCINLLRVLNKLCKWKHARIMMLIVFKSSPILKRTLKVRHSILQLYVLKLLKMQTKYLGRQWRKTNMKILSAIYQKVRHRLNDDWAYGNDPEARPWDFQTEECALRASVDRFNTRRYNSNSIKDPDFEPVDNCITSVLGSHVELTEEFKKHYEIWLQQEVFDTNIDWDRLLCRV